MCVIFAKEHNLASYTLIYHKKP